VKLARPRSAVIVSSGVSASILPEAEFVSSIAVLKRLHNEKNRASTPRSAIKLSSYCSLVYPKRPAVLHGDNYKSTKLWLEAAPWNLPVTVSAHTNRLVLLKVTHDGTLQVNQHCAST
jgi:hypothetical protein